MLTSLYPISASDFLPFLFTMASFSSPLGDSFPTMPSVFQYTFFFAYRSRAMTDVPLTLILYVFMSYIIETPAVT